MVGKLTIRRGDYPDNIIRDYFQFNSLRLSGTDIGVDQAKTIAAQQAGFGVNDVVFSKTKLERDDGLYVYEIEFYKDGAEYDCTINAANGSVLEYEVN